MADEQEQFGVKFQAGTESVTQAKEDFKHLTEEMKETSGAGQALAATTKTVDDAVIELRKQIADLEEVIRKQAEALAAGQLPLEVFLRGNQAARTVIGQLEGSIESLIGSDEGGGFKGVASNVIKAEKVISGLVSGSGFGRMGPMLESITGALGLAGGAGMAAGGLIFAFEALIPKIVTFIDKIDGAGAAAKRAAEQIAAAHEQMAKFITQPTEEEETGAKAVKGLLAGRGGVQVAQGIEQALRQQGVGLMAPGERAISEAFVGPEATAEAERKQQDKAVAIQREAIMRDLMAGRTPAISEVSGMAGQFPGLFPAGTEQHFRQALPENIEAARRQAQQAEVQSAQAEEEYGRREAAKKEGLDIQQEFDKARRDKQTKEAADRERIDADAEAGRAADERKAEQARRHAETLRRQTDAKAARDARENTPEAVEHRAHAAEQNEEMGMARQVQAVRANQGDFLASQMGPQELEQVVAQVGRNRMMNSSLGFTLAQQVNYYMGQLEAKMVADFARGMGQQNRTGQNVTPFGGY